MDRKSVRRIATDCSIGGAVFFLTKPFLLSFFPSYVQMVIEVTPCETDISLKQRNQR